MNANVLDRIVKDFIDFHADIIRYVTDETISDWWGMNFYNYGCSKEAIKEITEEIFNFIEKHKQYTVRDRQNGCVFEHFATLEEAERQVKIFEEEDKEEGFYEEESYEIVVTLNL